MMASKDPTGRVCSWMTGGPGKPGMCGKKATQHRKLHSFARVGKDNFFFVDAFYCDEHAEAFDVSPPPGEKAWREYQADPDKYERENDDPYLGMRPSDKGRSHVPSSRGGAAGGQRGVLPTDSKRVAPTDPKPKRSTSRRRSNPGPREPDHPTCTNVTMSGSPCRKPIAKKFIGKGDLYKLCQECADDLQIDL